MNDLILDSEKRMKFLHPFSNRASGHDEWLTPPEIIQALGKFDLDPCAPIIRPWPTASVHWTIEDNGLIHSWGRERVWLNPPYGNQTRLWIKRMADHKKGIAMIFARTETEMWFESIWNKAHSVFFFEGRINFHLVSGKRAKANSGAPSCLVSWSEFDSSMIATSGLKGKLVLLNNRI